MVDIFLVFRVFYFVFLFSCFFSLTVIKSEAVHSLADSCTYGEFALNVPLSVMQILGVLFLFI